MLTKGLWHAYNVTKNIEHEMSIDVFFFSIAQTEINNILNQGINLK